MSETYAAHPSAFATNPTERARAPVESIRKAVREDVREGRLWARARAAGAREAVQDHPIRAAAYAAGIGVVIGLLLRR